MSHKTIKFLQPTRTKLSPSTTSFPPPSEKRMLFEHHSQRLKLLTVLYQTALSFL